MSEERSEGSYLVEQQMIDGVGKEMAVIASQEAQMRGNNAVVTYTNASMLKLTDEEQAKLQAPVDTNEVEIRPDGLLYLPQVFVRDRLNTSFGIGQWALLQHGVTEIEGVLCFDGSLYVRGAFVARAMGEAKYIVSNTQQSWASVYESAKSDCLVRCCKDLGIAKELWQPAFGRKWQTEHAIKVWRDKTWNPKSKKDGVYQWRRKDVDPFYDEPTGKKQPGNTEPPPSVGVALPTPTPAIIETLKSELGAVATMSYGDFVTPFGKSKKGMTIRELRESDIASGIRWCKENNMYPEWVNAAQEFLKNPGELNL
jgi:hypothetical protein